VNLLDLGNRGLCFGRCSRRKEDLAWIVFSQLQDGLFTQAGIA
jgi:hypothetical protein